MSEDIHFKQTDLYDPKNDAQPSIHVYGAGSIGSHTVLSLAKTGFRDITVYDFDDVERGNIPAQMYDHGDAGDSKLHALDERVYRHVDDRDALSVVGGDITDYDLSDLDATSGSIHVLAVDNIDAREHVVKTLKSMPVHLLDGRIGGWKYELYYSDECNSNADNALINDYGEDNFADIECGRKCLYGVNAHIASLITSYIVRIAQRDRDAPDTYMRKGHFLSDTEITREEA